MHQRIRSGEGGRGLAKQGVKGVPTFDIQYLHACMKIFVFAFSEKIIFAFQGLLGGSVELRIRTRATEWHHPDSHHSCIQEVVGVVEGDWDGGEDGGAGPDDGRLAAGTAVAGSGRYNQHCQNWYWSPCVASEEIFLFGVGFWFCFFIFFLVFKVWVH